MIKRSPELKKNSGTHLKSVIFISILMLSSVLMGQGTFIHPGILHKTSEKDRIKYSVLAKADPWYASYQLLIADSKSGYNYRVYI